jgi:hypothetical protein
LLAIFCNKGTVEPNDAINMTPLSPTARLEWLYDQSHIVEAHAKIREVLDHYEQFLADTDRPEEELIELFLDREKSKQHMRSANILGDLTFQVIELIGQRSPFHRVLVV